MSKTLYLIRGLPGSGKTTFAKTLAESLETTYHEADQYFYDDDKVYRFRREYLKDAHEACQWRVERIMKLTDDPVIVSNTFTTEKELKPYLALAEKYGYRVVSLIVENRHGNQSVHSVPEETIQKMKNRFSIKL